MSRAARAPRSLQAKALQLLAQREQSRVELQRKLVAYARTSDRVEAAAKRLLDPRSTGAAAAVASRDAASASNLAGAAGTAANHDPADDDGPSVTARVEAVLTWLEAHRFSSDDRFAESRVHARQGRFGNLRIRRELSTHAISLSPEAASQLAESELPRAIDVCCRRFAAPPTSAAEAVRQSRFLIARGFSPEVVRRALRSRARDDGSRTDRGDDANVDEAVDG